MSGRRRRSFRQVDVFATEPFLGNPVAVVLDGEGLEDEQFRAVARWTNLSETTFVLPATASSADYRVRIFTPDVELPFAGHPTLGTAHAWLEAGGTPARRGAIVQECAAGLVEVRRDAARLAFAAPPQVRSGDVDENLVARLARVLRIAREDIVATQWVDNGPGWVAVLLADADAVLAVEPDFGSERHLDVGVVGPYPARSPCAWEIRAFFRADGPMTEDPVTGSLNASLAQWLLASGRAQAPYVASQGGRLGRRGRVHISQDGDGTVWVGGATTTHVVGHLLG